MTSKIFLTSELVLNTTIVQKNNQNNGDFTTLLSSVIVLTVEPGMNISTFINIILITIVSIIADLRHLYLSVIAPVIGRNNKPGSGTTVKMKPTMSGE